MKGEISLKKIIWIIYFLLMFYFFIRPMFIKKNNVMHRINKNNVFKSEHLKKFIGKKCNIRLINATLTNILGTITAIVDDWLIIETENNGLDMINIRYITQLSEWPAKVKQK